MKYRRLTHEELEPLQEEFLKYLMVANITPENWEQLKAEKHPSCEKHIETFSDLVLEKILQEVRFINIVLPNRLEVYQFTKRKAYLFTVENKVIDSQDLSHVPLSNVDMKSITIIKGEKELEERELEIFKLLKREGASIADGDLFKKIALLVASSS